MLWNISTKEICRIITEAKQQNKFFTSHTKDGRQ